MFDLTRFSLKEMTLCGEALRQTGTGTTNMEEAANRIVQYLYNHLLDSFGEKASILVRFFITQPYSDLEIDLQQHACTLLGKQPDDPELLRRPCTLCAKV